MHQVPAVHHPRDFHLKLLCRPWKNDCRDNFKGTSMPQYLRKWSNKCKSSPTHFNERSQMRCNRCPYLFKALSATWYNKDCNIYNNEPSCRQISISSTTMLDKCNDTLIKTTSTFLTFHRRFQLQPPDRT
jgi:hypothetical protein